MDLDPRNRGIERRRFNIEKSDGGGAEEGQFAGQLLWLNGAVEHIERRDIKAPVMLAEFHPNLAVAVGRHIETLQLNAGDSTRAIIDRHGRLARAHAIKFKRQRRVHIFSHPHHERHLANDAVHRRLKRKHTNALGRIFEHIDIADNAGECPEERLRL